jgi:RHS repeat-associated protein
VSHILRNRTTNPSTGVATDRWFHYDQVGSVLSESDAAGALAQTHHQDAFGNTQAAWQTGLWGGDRAGWHHNTKELDGDTGLVYMHQRWYAPETGTFMSSAPYPVTMEHRYGFAAQNPIYFADPFGEYEFGFELIVGVGGGIIVGYDPETGALSLTCRLSVGCGAGVMANPNLDFEDNTERGGGAAMGCYGEAGASAGGFKTEAEFHAGVNGSPDAVYGRAKAEAPGFLTRGGRSPIDSYGAGIHGGIEFQITKAGRPAVDHGALDKSWKRADSLCKEAARKAPSPTRGRIYRDCMKSQGF